MKKKLKSGSRSKIELWGTLGEFNVANSNYTLKYFSTVANNKAPGSAQSSLLSKLSPMREKTNPEKITNLGALLQRDLNDKRVADELIPYLSNTEGLANHIAFFPSILCVLIPKHFITPEDDEEISYPKYQENFDSENEELLLDYDKYWKYKQIYDGESPLPIAQLTIFDADTELVVIDGQHRANAFRVLSNSFKPEGRNQIYAHFYSHVVKPEKFDADLPVTILWFESDDHENSPVKPDLISRKLFVDVNNTGKYISTSRLILLDDVDPSSLMTRFFYSYIAEKHHFDNNSFSLFHSGFDFDDNLKSKKSSPSIFSLTVPEIIHYVIDWMMFGKLDFNDLDKQSGSEARRVALNNFSTYIAPYKDYIEFKADNDDVLRKQILSDVDLESFEELFNEKFGQHLYNLFNSFPLTKPHIEAGAELDLEAKNYQNDFSSEVWQETWKKIFRGGEGLYYVYKRSNQSNLKAYENAINSITNLFKIKRASRFKSSSDNVNQAYTSFATLAFQVGFIKSFDVFYRQPDKYYEIEDAVHDFIKRIEKITPDMWIHLLTKVRELYIPRINPKMWPSYKNIILRLIQAKDEFYNCAENTKYSPDVVMVNSLFMEKCKSYIAAEFELKLDQVLFDQLDQSKLKKYIEDSRTEVDELFKPLKLKSLKFDYETHCLDLLSSKCKPDEE